RTEEPFDPDRQLVLVRRLHPVVHRLRESAAAALLPGVAKHGRVLDDADRVEVEGPDTRKLSERKGRAGRRKGRGKAARGSVEFSPAVAPRVPGHPDPRLQLVESEN